MKRKAVIRFYPDADDADEIFTEIRKSVPELSVLTNLKASRSAIVEIYEDSVDKLKKNKFLESVKFIPLYTW